MKLFSKDKEKIQNHWREEIYPRQNSIVLNNGFYCLFEISHDESRLTKKVWLPALDLIQGDADNCEGLATLQAIETSIGEQIIGGECLAAGEDGFIALIEKDTEQLIWLVVLSGTNPFETLELKGHFIHATSSSGTVVTLPIDQPDKLSIAWN